MARQSKGSQPVVNFPMPVVEDIPLIDRLHTNTSESFTQIQVKASHKYKQECTCTTKGGALKYVFDVHISFAIIREHRGGEIPTVVVQGRA